MHAMMTDHLIQRRPRLRPDFGIAHLNAARMRAAKGDVPSEERHLRQAASSPDPNIRSKAAAALRQMGRQ
jgi:hypothetical protein